MNVFPVVLLNEAIRVESLLTEQNIPVARYPYSTKNNTQQYCLIFNNDTQTRAALLQTTPKPTKPDTKQLHFHNAYIKKMVCQIS